ncbi:Mucin-12 [Lignoscripta atroalba]|nr:Mucin-12 [Lignoscripta atroalba]
MDIQWRSPFSAIKLAFIAEDGDVFQFFSQNNSGSDFTWPVNVNNSGSASPFYYLYFENQDDNTQHYYSALFKVVNPVNAEQTSTAPATVTITPTPVILGSAITQGGTTVIITRSITLSLPSEPTTVSSSSSSPSTPSSASSASSQIGGAGSNSNPTDSSTSTSTESSGSSTPTAAGASAASTLDTVPPPSPGGLSQGAKIGIGIGVPIGVITLVGLGVLAVWRSWRHSRAAKQDPHSTGISQDPAGYADDNNAPVTGAAGYRRHESAAYNGGGQETAKIPNQPVMYTPVQQQQGMSEMPNTNLHNLPPSQHHAPHEMDGYGDGYGQGGYRGYM